MKMVSESYYFKRWYLNLLPLILFHELIPQAEMQSAMVMGFDVKWAHMALLDK
jgi:hypothetical protein